MIWYILGRQMAGNFSKILPESLRFRFKYPNNPQEENREIIL